MPHGGALVETRLPVVDDAWDHKNPEASAAGQCLVVKAARKVESLAEPEERSVAKHHDVARLAVLLEKSKQRSLGCFG